MDNQAAVGTLREFLLQKFPNLLSLRNASDLIVPERSEWNEDMILDIAPPGLDSKKLATAYCEFFGSKGYEVHAWDSGMYFLQRDKLPVMGVWHTFASDGKNVMISVMPIRFRPASQ